LFNLRLGEHRRIGSAHHRFSHPDNIVVCVAQRRDHGSRDILVRENPHPRESVLQREHPFRTKDFASVCQTRVDVIERHMIVLLADLLGGVTTGEQLHDQLDADSGAFDGRLADEHIGVGRDSFSPVHVVLAEILSIMRRAKRD
jgi:hypothetical protein